MNAVRPGGISWIREREAVLLLLFGVAVFFTQLSALPLVGEETRRALIAREMAESGDWIVPRQQGRPRLTKPPIQYWAIAASTALFGEESLTAIRLPSALAIVLTALVIYGYARNFLGRGGALAAGLSFLTTVEILHSGRFAQIDPLFTFFLASAFLIWHWGYLNGWRQLTVWMSGYVLTALAALTKGPQAPVYFIAGTAIYLALERDWRFLFCKAHALALVVFTVLVAGWVVPLWSNIGRDGVLYLWTGETVERSRLLRVEFLAHLLRFPVELSVCTLPWSALLLVYLRADFRRSLGAARPAVKFLACSLGIALPTCWLPPGGEARYLMPLYPCLACLAGVVVDRMGRKEAVEWLPGRLVQVLWLVGMSVMLLAVTAAFAACVHRPAGAAGAWLLPRGQALLYGSLVLGMAVLYWRASRVSSYCPTLGHALLACCVGLTYNWAVLSRTANVCRDTKTDVALARRVVPEGTPLVSLDPIHHRFAYYYGKPIGVVDWRTAHELPPESGCFCFECTGGAQPTFPFAWQQIAVVPMDRFHRDGPPKVVVVIGKRLPEATLTAARYSQ